MRLIIYCAHPAQYHFFKNILKKLSNQNHTIKLLIKTKDVLEDLLGKDGLEYINILPEGRTSSHSGIFYGLLKRDVRLFKIASEFKPDMMLGSDPSLAHIGKLLNIPVLTTLEDDYQVIPKLSNLTYPFTSYIIAPASCDCGKWNYKKISYAGYMKLAYLHPAYFTMPKNDNDKKLFLIRTTKLDAHHDFGVNGFTKEILTNIIHKLEKFGEVRLLSEGQTDSAFIKYLLKINPNEIHNYLAQVYLLVSDSQSMSMEAAMLGVPSIRFSDFAGRIGVLEELEKKYKLTFGIRPDDKTKLFEKLDELLNMSNLRESFELRRQQMLKDKINVTEFFVWLIENYPNSIKEMQANPEIQNQFK